MGKPAGHDWRRIGYFDNGHSYVITFHMPSEFRFETWVKNLDLTNGHLNTLETYRTEGDALHGHAKWVRTVEEVDRLTQPPPVPLSESEPEPDIVFQRDTYEEAVATVFVGPQEKDKKDVKISFNALIRILSQNCGERYLNVQGNVDNPQQVILSIDGGTFEGQCIYDWGIMMAKDVSTRWDFLIDEAKNDILDKRAAKILSQHLVGL